MSSEHDSNQELKTALAELTPSPWLEDAASEIARETPVDVGTRGFGRRWAAALAAAAVLVVSFAWVAFRAAQDPEVSVLETGEGLDGVRAVDADMTPNVLTPWSPRQVGRARKTSPLPYFGDREVDAGTWITIGSLSPGSTIGMDGPADGPPAFNADLMHRYAVNGSERGPYVERDVKAVSLSEPGVMLGGLGLLEILGDAILSGAGRTAVVHLDGKQWRSVPTQPDLELILGSPEPGGAEARVRVRLSTAYTGALLVEEPIARALGLHQYEIPGGVHVGGSLDLHATVARARVRIPELGVDKTLSVEVRPWRGWNVVETKRDSNSKASAWIQVKGALPDAIAHADEVRLTADKLRLTGGVGLEVVQAPDRQDAMTLGLGGSAQDGRVEAALFREGPTQLCLQYNESADQPAALLFLGSVDILPQERWTYVYDARWITLAQPATPGAQVVVARTWRGSSAIPSKDGVAVTRVGADGRIRFPWVRGEAGDALRLRIQHDGGWMSHDVRLGADTGIVAELLGDGIRLQGRDHGSDLASLREHLRSLVVVRESDGSAALTLEIRAAGDTEWRAVQRLLRVAAEPGIQIARIAYGRTNDPEAPIVTALPKDRGLGKEPPKSLSITLWADDAGDRGIVATYPGAGAPPVRLPLPLVEQFIQEWLERHADSVGVISVDVGADGSLRRYSDVRPVLRALASGGLSTITFVADGEASRR